MKIYTKVCETWYLAYGLSVALILAELLFGWMAVH